jgi:hypothetical protein
MPPFLSVAQNVFNLCLIDSYYLFKLYIGWATWRGYVSYFLLKVVGVDLACLSL